MTATELYRISAEALTTTGIPEWCSMDETDERDTLIYLNDEGSEEGPLWALAPTEEHDEPRFHKAERAQTIWPESGILPSQRQDARQFRPSITRRAFGGQTSQPPGEISSPSPFRPIERRVRAQERRGGGGRRRMCYSRGTSQTTKCGAGPVLDAELWSLDAVGIVHSRALPLTPNP